MSRTVQSKRRGYENEEEADWQLLDRLARDLTLSARSLRLNTIHTMFWFMVLLLSVFIIGGLLCVFIWSLINDEALLAADPFNEVIEAQRAAAVETKDPEQENYQLAESCV